MQKYNKFKVQLVLEFTRDKIPIDAGESIQFKEMIIRPKDESRKLIAIFKINEHIMSMIHGQPFEYISKSKQIIKKDQETIVFFKDSLSL